MIKTPLSTAIGGVGFYTKNAVVIGSGHKTEPPFDIASLFENGEQGFWLDPSDLSTMFQDAAGTILVTGVGQPVGLMLDKSKGLVLGSNQISYPNSEELPATASMPTGAYTWTLNTDSPISGTQDSRLTVTAPASQNGRPYLYFICSSELVAGKLYKFSFRYKVNSGAPRIIQVHNGSGIIAPTSDKGLLQGSGTFDVFIRWLAGSNTRPYVYFSNESVFDLQINDISVREISGNHAYQTTSSARPLLQDNVQFDSIDDVLNVMFESTLTGCTLVTVKYGEQAQILDNQTINQAHIINKDFKQYLLINRALTTQERTQVLDYFNKIGAAT